MRLKMLLMISALSITLTFSACCEPRVEYVDRPVQVKVPVKCKVPDVNCTLGGKNLEVVARAYECIALQKQAMEVCK